jgi:hypothetical protein
MENNDLLLGIESVEELEERIAPASCADILD